MSSNIYFVSRCPSPLGYNCSVGRFRGIVEKRRGLERNAWRRALHQVAIVHYMPCTLTVYDAIVLEEVLGP